MKRNNQFKCYALAGVAALWLAGNVLADDAAKPPCCGGMTTPMDTSSSTNAVPDLLKTCPVSGEILGEMGKPFTFNYKDQEVKLCCKSCKKDFDKDPAKYIKLIRAADKK